MRTEVLVVGGGPAGSTAAMRLAANHEVAIVEEHRIPGKPIQCAGLVTPRGVPDIARGSVLGQVRGARIHSPLGFVLNIESREPRALVIDRQIFDADLFEAALDSGAKPLTETRLTSLNANDDHICVETDNGSSKLEIDADIVIGADGHRSVCREAAGCKPARHMLRGAQVELKGVHSDRDMVDLYLGSKVAPGFFAWAIPAEDMTRVGLCTWGKEHLPAVYLKKLLSRPEFAKAIEVSRSSGRIPIGAGRSAVGDRIMLVGDAACHAKPLSGGGVYTGTKGAALCADVVSRHLDNGGDTALSTYDDLWKKSFGTELARAFRIRKVFLALTDNKMDQALRMFEDPEVRSLIEKRGDIDYPSALSKKVLKLAPKLAQFSPQLIKSLL
ncbi:MAG: NAD(P)/FAD-dependent oxidoreductase [Methanobacteriota archaeon]|nr:MAG: NAD(P)/FAD-dependent oxidoreductase [Euryarchaeota archaeon]